MTGGEDPFGDLQLRGIAAASEVFDRLAAELGGTSAAAGAAPAPRAGGAAAADDTIGRQQLRAAAARTIDLFAGLLQQTFESYVELVQELVAPPGAGASDAAGARSDLSLAGPPGGNAVATIWIHNATDRPANDVVLRLTDLTDHACARIDASLARFLPARLLVDAGASASSLLSLAIPPRTEPGIYFGHVLAGSLPAAGLPVRLVVEGERA